MAASGGGVSVEIPYGSLVPQLPEWKDFVTRAGLKEIIIDLCEYGLCPPDDLTRRYRKRVALWSNIPQLFGLARSCGGGHEHIRVRGGVRVAGRVHRRATLASFLPGAFCDALSAAVTSA